MASWRSQRQTVVSLDAGHQSGWHGMAGDLGHAPAGRCHIINHITF